MKSDLTVSDTEFPGPYGQPVKVRIYIPERAMSTGIVWHTAADSPAGTSRCATFEWATLNDLGAGTCCALGGASAGGNLAASAALRLLHHQKALPAHVVLAYPTVHASQMELDPVAQTP